MVVETKLVQISDLELLALRREIEELQQQKLDLEILLENTTEHATEIENELEERNSEVQTIMLALRRELEVGRQVQSDFLPQFLPEIKAWNLTACFSPARDVAGDFYDVFTLPGGLTAFVMADVCDKGVGAALFMSLIRSLLRVLANQAHSRLQHFRADLDSYLVKVKNKNGTLLLPAHTHEVLSIISLVNDYIAVNHSRTNMFVTLFVGIIDQQAGIVSYVNGGHDAPIVVGKDGIKTRLMPSGPAVGVMDGVKFQMRQVQLEPGDFLLAYTDGVSEALNMQEEMFTEKQLLALVETVCQDATLTTQQLLDRINEAVQAHVGDAPPSDDVTLLALQYQGN